VKRIDTAYGEEGGDLFAVGSRLYLNVWGRDGETRGTIIGDPLAFARGSSSWQLGTMPRLISSQAFGNDRTLYAIGDQGKVQKWDVSRPRAARLLDEYARPQHSQMVEIASGKALLFDGAPFGRVVDLSQTVSIVSRVWRITLQARDAQGAVREVSRVVHLVPYDHAPSISAAQVKGSLAGEDIAFEIAATDPDRATTWDPNLFVRGDLDGDGIYETEWSYVPGKEPLTLLSRFATPGKRTLRFQVKDGFFATAETSLEVDIK
jgi:hypothetical protein